MSFENGKSLPGLDPRVRFDKLIFTRMTELHISTNPPPMPSDQTSCEALERCALEYYGQRDRWAGQRVFIAAMGNDYSRNTIRNTAEREVKKQKN